MASKLRAEQVDLVSFKRIFATTDSLSSVSKDIVFVIPHVSLGGQPTEILFPYYGKVKKILTNLSSNNLLTEELIINAECKRDGAWMTVDGITVQPDEITATKLVLPNFSINMETLRLNVVSCQEGLVNLVVIISITATV